MQPPSDDLETRLDALLGAGNLEQAATLAIDAYGGEIYGFLRARLGNEEQTNDVYSRFLEALWSGLPGYARRASFRAWAYAVARNARNRYLDREVRPRRREAALSEAPHFADAAEAIRTRTALHLRTTGHDRAAVLRSKLEDEEQALLTLRIDRQLAWREVAEALGAPGADLDAEAARLRKRFQLVKNKLAKWAKDAGWLNTES